MNDSLGFRTHWTIEKYADDAAYARGEPYAVSEFDGNLAVNAGLNLLWTLVCGGAGTAFSAANAYIGVGDSSTPAAAAQTDLQAASNKLRVGMDANYPTYGTSQKATWKATLNGAQGNWAWEEFGVFNAAAAGTMLNRKCSSKGTKSSGQTWSITVEITAS